ncbi:MAG: thioredoxin family protein [Lentisphaerae bacterium]|nr:thioredoxin family protein [Lentisphaerota bacterium]
MKRGKPEAEPPSQTVPVPLAVATSNETQEAAKGEALPRLVDLGAGRCIPCKLMAPIIEELKQEYAGTFSIDFIDVWEHPEVGVPYGVRMIPTQIFYDAAGAELFRHEGFFSKEDILATWEEYGVDVLTRAGE